MAFHLLECVATKAIGAYSIHISQDFSRCLLLVSSIFKVAFMSPTLNSAETPSSKLFAWGCIANETPASHHLVCDFSSTGTSLWLPRLGVKNWFVKGLSFSVVGVS